MLNSILVPVDESPAAQKAIDLAVELAAPLGASIQALAVIDAKMVRPPGSEALRATLDASAARLLEGVSTRCRARNVPVTALPRVVGSPQGEIVEQASKCDLVVLGRKGLSADGKQKGPGSVATYVLRRSRTPRLFIDETAPLPRRILVGFDGSADARAALAVAGDLARATRYPLTVFHANPEGQSGGVLQAIAALLGPDAKPEVLEIIASPMTVCLQRLSEKPDTLFVLGAHGAHRVSDWLLGTVTERLHYETCATLLVCGSSS